MRFKKENDHYLDTKTGLHWQLEQNKKKLSWEKAVKCSKTLEDGWRLPTIQELTGIIDYTKSYPATDLPGMMAAHYWSSTTTARSSGVAWYVGFYDGYVHDYYKSDSFYVRAVLRVERDRKMKIAVLFTERDGIYSRGSKMTLLEKEYYKTHSPTIPIENTSIDSYGVYTGCAVLDDGFIVDLSLYKGSTLVEVTSHKGLLVGVRVDNEVLSVPT